MILSAFEKDITLLKETLQNEAESKFFWETINITFMYLLASLIK